MSVQVWIGEKPEHPNERRAIVALANGLDRLDGLYLILANFSVGGRSIDLVIIKQDAIFIIELKHCDGKVFGDVNGPWYAESANGARKRLNPGRKNPYNQVISYYYSLINFLNERRSTFLSPNKSSSVDFRTCKRIVVIAPTIQPGSQIDVDWKVEYKGLDELPAYLVTERSSEIDLSDEEMLAIPELLHCTRWQEVNALIAGVLPQWEATPSEPAETPVPVALPEPTPAPTPSPATLTTRMRAALHTWPGRAAVAFATLALVLALALVLRPAPRPLIDTPAAGVSLLRTDGPAGGNDPVAIAPTSSCVWSGFQFIGRRRGAEPNAWENVGIIGAPPDLAPDVVVTLEEVSVCEGEITMHWSLQNNLDDATVTLPLNTQNVFIRDEHGNTYPVDASRTEPLVIRARPNQQARGTLTVGQATSLNATTLRVVLRQQPFGEATWLVPIGDLDRS